MTSASAAASARMPAAPWYRQAHLLLALVAGSGLLLRLILVIVHPDPAPDDPDLLTRLVRFISYFTIQSNIAVLLASLMVLRGRDLDTPAQRALRLASLVGISVTGIVYVLLLAGSDSHEGLSAVANALLHYLTPPLAVAIWLAAGPWPGLNLVDLARMMVWPVAWIAYTLIRGAIVGWYPYDFINVDLKGAGSVATMVGVIVASAVVFGALIGVVDRWRGRSAEARA